MPLRVLPGLLGTVSLGHEILRELFLFGVVASKHGAHLTCQAPEDFFVSTAMAVPRFAFSLGAVTDFPCGAVGMTG